MSLSADGLDSFGQLAIALGILDADGSPNPAWFGDPVGNGSNPHGLRAVLSDDDQRNALVAFVDQVLGPPDREQIDEAVWVPLFRNSSPEVTVYAVVKPVTGAVHLGVGVEHATTGALPTVATRVHVPVFQLPRGSSSPSGSGSLPAWLLLGRAGGRIEVSVDATLRSGAPPAGEPSLGGLAVTLEVPSAEGDDLGVRLALRDLQLPGAAAPTTFTLDADSLGELGPDVFQLVVGLVRAQADAIDASVAGLRPFAGLTGMLGLRTVANLPPLPLSELPTAGVQAVVTWLESILATNAARDAWLGQLVLLLGGAATLDAARDAVSVALGPATLTLGLRVETGTGGHPLLTPWAEVALATTPGARVRVAVDLLEADTGTGAVTAVPDLRAEAVFGADAGGSVLASGTPHIGSLHVGMGLTSARRPTFLLTLHDVTVVTGQHHDVLDLSSPQAALDAASTVLDDAVNTALASLGAAGALVCKLIGTAPPSGVAALEAVALVADPIAAITGYWQGLVASAPGMAEVLGALRRLVLGGVAAAAPGTGTAGDPWRIDFAAGVGLRVWLDAGTLVVDVAAELRTPVLGDFAASTSLALTLLRASFSPAQATFASKLRGSLRLERADHATAHLDLGSLIDLQAQSVGVGLSWSPAAGFGAALEAEGLALTLGNLGRRIAIPLPTLDASGNLTLPSPPWADIEAALGALLSSARMPILDAAVAWLGWNDTGPRLHLAALLGPHPELEIEAWLADQVLDCQRLGELLAPVAALLSGFSVTQPSGTGSVRSPYRCPVAGDSRAPGLAAWLVPDCPPRPDAFALPLSGFLQGLPPEPDALVGALGTAARSLPDVADLLVGRDSLAQGLQLLADRWTGTDGLVGEPTVLPDGVGSVVLDGYSYDELVALGSCGQLLGDAFDTPPGAVVHVGCESTWSTGRPSGFVFDATGAAGAGAGRIPATGNGTWFVRLPSPAEAAALRPDRGAVGEQAARLAEVLGSRTGALSIVAYGAAGAAALRAAATVTAVDQVATVGTPWAGLSVDSLHAGLSGDALVLLQRIARADAVDWPDTLLALEASPLQVMRRLVARAAVVQPTELPSASTEAVRPGLDVTAVFGGLDADTVLTGMGALLADGIGARLDAARAAAPAESPHTELHVGVDLPVADLNLGGLLVGVGATLELASLVKTGSTVHAAVARGLLVELHLGVHDGWLVGGPGASQPDVDTRWMTLHLAIPFDGRPGDAELVLHEARAFSAYRERWVVRADGDGVAATTALPEVGVMLSGVMARVLAASPELGQLLALVGLVRDGGLDPDGLDRLVHDPKATILGVATAGPTALAAALRGLLQGASGTGAGLTWTSGPASVTLDLAARSLGATLDASVAGLPAIGATVTASPAGASADITLGTLDAQAGGVRLTAHAGISPSVALEWQAPGEPVRRLPLLPTFDASALTPFVTTLLPAALAQQLLGFLRANAENTGRAALEGALDVVGLLGPVDASSVRPVLLPLGLFDAPGAWLTGAVAAWRSDPVGSATTLLEALVPLVAPSRPAGTSGWPIAPGVALAYAAVDGGLQIAADVNLSATLDGTAISTELLAGLRLSPSAPPAPALAVGLLIGGRGVRIELTPSLRISLLRPSPLEIYPNGPGLGTALASAGEMVLPPVLNALAGHRNDPGSGLGKDVGSALFDLGGALDLLDAGAFTADRLDAFAADPSARLVARIPQLVGAGAAALAHALDPAGTLVHVTGPSAGRLTLGFGSTQALKLVLDGATATPAIELQASTAVPGLGHVALDALRLSADGVQVTARFGPAVLSAGALVLRPMVVVKAGVASGSFTRLLGLDLALDDAGEDAVEFRWTLDAQPPSLVVVTRPPASAEVVSSDPGQVALRLLALGASMASSVLLDALAPVLSTSTKDFLRGVVFTDAPASTTLDAALFTDLLEPPRLFTRLERLLWNAATGATPLSVTIDGKVTIGLCAQALSGGAKQLGLNVSLAPGQSYAIATGDPQVALEIDATWVDPALTPGLSVFVLKGTPGAGSFDFQLAPAVAIAGIGLRFSKDSGPLLSLGGMSLDAIALHLYGEAREDGLGGGVQIELGGLAIAPGGAGGSNGVANGILSDAGSSSPSSRPAFSPALAIQHHPGQSGVGVSLRAGQPPGPWWLVVQRQLGPLYVERVGFDSAEQNGKVTRISLLFDGRVSLFGLTASVDQLSMTWLGGDVADIHSWAVDLQGLAVSADLSGVSLSGGLLKSTAGDGAISYVGMLMGRFGVYGLSVFGGYTDDHGSPSFFVFGALNGPIGGPPAFFITGVGGGLGINRGLKVPDDFSHFGEYPFIQALDPSAHPPADPMAELRKLGDYFPPARGQFWFAAGISFTCFTLVDGIAVLSVSFGNGLDINLFGLARMALPRPEAALVSIELGLLARFSTEEGLFSIRAQLTENSWLLYPDVRLTGGFAFVVWWKGANKGQFVLTLGGYHPSFHRDGYPDVPRLGLVWHISDAITIKGESYFALTSEALMAGVDVEVSVDFGFVWARIAFGANGIVYFDPFWFEVEAYARISAGVKIDTFFGTISIGVSLGASLKVWGPDFSGEATFDVGPVSVTVPFGSERQVPGRVLAWPEFVGKYLEDDNGAARVLSAIAGRGALPAATKGGVAAPTSDGSPERPFEVFAEFELSFVTTVPTRAFDLGLASGPVAVPVLRSDGAAASLGLKPMQASDLTSTVAFTLERKIDGNYTSEPARLQKLGANLAAASPRPEGSTVSTDAFPIGAWGAPEPQGQTTKPLPKGDVLFAGNGVRLVAEAELVHRGPEVDYYRVEAARRPLPLQAGGPTRAALLGRAAEVTATFPTVTTANQALAAAEVRLFASPAAPPAGVLDRGRYSNLARASFSVDRVAPPLFGSLADGLAVTNAADGAASIQPPPAPPQPPIMRAPVVTALLTSGAGVAMRAATTSVADKRIKRRTAPTIDGVQARTALHLPVQLTVSPLPAAAKGGTVLAVGTLPRTDAVGTTRAYAAGLVGGPRGLDGFVAGLGGAQGVGKLGAGTKLAAAAATAPTLAPGDLLVMSLPDASVDVSAQARPVLSVDGEARVTMLKGNGTVVLDGVRSGVVSVPPGVALLAVQSGTPADPSGAAGGLLGWHAAGRIASLGSHAAAGAGCVLTMDAPGAGVGVRWATAADVIAGAGAVATRFTQPARTLVLVLADDEPTRAEGPELELIGAARAKRADGSPEPPTVVLRGGEAAMIYALDGAGKQPFTVRVRTGGDWRLAGVLAGALTADQAAQLLSARGAQVLASRLLASTGSGCRVGWQQPSTDPAPQRDRTVKPAARAKPVAKAKPIAKTKRTTRTPTERKPPTSRKPAAKRAQVPRPKRRSAAPTRRKRGN
jgi:hypothetical protein